MKHTPFLCVAAALALACFAASESAGQSSDRNASQSQTASSPSASVPSAALKQKVMQEYGKLPLGFEANQGQTDPKVKFLSRGPGYQLFLLPHEAIIRLQKQRHAQHARRLANLLNSQKIAERDSDPPEIISMALLN